MPSHTVTRQTETLKMHKEQRFFCFLMSTQTRARTHIQAPAAYDPTIVHQIIPKIAKIKRAKCQTKTLIR